MKTIGYVLAEFPVFSETFVGDEMRAMMRHGHPVVPIVMHPQSGPAQEEDRALAKNAIQPGRVDWRDMMSLLLAPGSRRFAALKFVLGQARLPRTSLAWNAFKIAAIARKYGCGHLHAHFAGGAAAHAIVAARLAGISVSFVCHGHDVYAEPEDLDLKLTSADTCIAVCNDLADDLGSIAPQSKITVVPCGIDPSKFKPSASGHNNGKLLFIGRLVEQKGMDDLLNALARASTATLDIVGDGPLKQQYQAQAEALGIAARVNFLGSRPREWLCEEAPKYLGLVAPFKVAPDGARDTGPLVAKEAMAMGMPVVASRFMGLKEIVAPGTGFLSAPGDAEDLAKAIEQLKALSEQMRDSMGRTARDHVVANYTLTAQAAALSKAFEAA